jgi:hypothetical protein
MNAINRLYLTNYLVKQAGEFHPLDQFREMLNAPNQELQDSKLRDRLILASLVAGGGAGLGGVLGGGARAIDPNEEDEAKKRGILNRSLRGGFHGAATGAGGAIGGAAGALLPGPLNIEKNPYGMLLGAGSGALLSNLLARKLIR